MTDTPPGRVDSPPDEAAVSALAAASVDTEAVPSDVNIVFRQQPKPVEARHRIAYRTALLVLVLSRFNRGAAKLTNLHTVMWATRSARTRRMFSAWWSGRRFYNTATDRLDPDLQITLNLALVDGVIAPASKGTRVRLTDKGQELARLIDQETGLLAVEKLFLGTLQRISDASIENKLGEVPG
jgi:hypothetical protein